MAHKKQIEYFLGVRDTCSHRYFDFNAAILMEANATGDAMGIVELLQTAKQHYDADEKGKGGVIISNVIMGVLSALEKSGQIPIAHAAMVRTIDGQDVSHLTAEQVAEMLKDEPDSVASMWERILRFKKKIEAEIAVTNPKYSGYNLAEEVADQVLRRNLAKLEGIITGNFDEEEIASIEEIILSYHEPTLIGGADGAYVKQLKSTSKLFSDLEKAGLKNPRMMSVFDLLTMLEGSQKQG